MAIRTSLAKQIDPLIADLSSNSEVTREAAIARLTVIGPRAVARLVSLVESGSAAAARACALRALEAIGDRHALEPALAATCDADVNVATAAIGVARTFLRGPHGTDALDRLTAIALDTRRDERIRRASIHALGELSPATLKPLWKKLKGDRGVGLPSESGRHSDRPGSDDLKEAADGVLPEHPGALRDALVVANEHVPLAALHRLVERVREREAGERPNRRAEWTRTRGMAHVTLARRGSRVALYDLRESLEAATTPLPVEFVTALSLVGDASCLEAIAAAYTRATDIWWRRHLVDTFRGIVKREGLTRRHAVIKRIEKRWSRGFKELWPTGAGRAGGAAGAGGAGKAGPGVK